MEDAQIHEPSRFEFGVLAFSALALAAASIWMSTVPPARANSIRRTRSELEGIAAATTLYQALHPRVACPSPSVLKQSGILDGAFRELDPWNNPIRIACQDEEHLTVESNGPDGIRGSEDDIAVRN